MLKFTIPPDLLREIYKETTCSTRVPDLDDALRDERLHIVL
jgi:hypothetical protein